MSILLNLIQTFTSLPSLLKLLYSRAPTSVELVSMVSVVALLLQASLQCAHTLLPPPNHTPWIVLSGFTTIHGFRHPQGWVGTYLVWIGRTIHHLFVYHPQCAWPCTKCLNGMKNSTPRSIQFTKSRRGK